MKRFGPGGLGLKLFLSHLVVLVVGIVLVLVVADSVTPTFFDMRMEAGMPGMGRGPGLGVGLGPGVRGMAGTAEQLDAAVAASFRGALAQGLVVAGIGAGIVAILASLFLTRRLIRPIDRLDAASRRIAEGHYGERVAVEGDDELTGLAESFNAMAGVLETTEQRRLDLIGDVAHELRTPIATLRGYLEGLLDGVVPAEPETWARLDGEAARLQRLVGDLQELSRAEARQIPLDLQTLDPAGVLRAAVDRLADAYAQKQVGLSVSLGSPLPAVRADHGRAIQVLTNLLSNALRYTPEGGTVRVGAQARGDTVEIAVTDTGSGVAPEHLPHLFERFYRADPARSRAQGGSGIGLTISRALVEAMGGEISASSPGLGKGSTFRFTLPMAASAEPAAPATVEPARRGAPA